MKKVWIVVLTFAILVVPASTALAASGDRDHDGLPDRWERQHGLSVHRASGNADPDRDRVDNRNEYREGTDPRRRDSDRDRRPDGREDRDGDGLSNAAEDRSGNDPDNPDTDGDGIGDADEHAGTVTSFSGGRLTIALATGGTLTAAVSDDTDVGCGSENAAELARYSVRPLLPGPLPVGLQPLVDQRPIRAELRRRPAHRRALRQRHWRQQRRPHRPSMNPMALRQRPDRQPLAIAVTPDLLELLHSGSHSSVPPLRARN